MSSCEGRGDVPTARELGDGASGEGEKVCYYAWMGGVAKSEKALAYTLHFALWVFYPFISREVCLDRK